MGSRQPRMMTELYWKNSDVYFSEEDPEVVVAKFTNAHHVVMEVMHYVAALDGELQEEQVT